MAIATNAGAAGVRVTTSAWCIACAPAQCHACLTNATEVLLTGLFAANNCNVCACITFVDRVVTLRRDTCTEERRRITAEQVVCTCCTILTVHEAWCANPATNDNIDVGYVIQDAATVTGFTLINKRVQDYASSRPFRVGDCPPNAYAQFDLLDGASLETCDRGLTCCADIFVRACSTFGNGYRASGVGVNGGYFIGTPGCHNELVFEAQNGAHLRICDKLFFPMVNNPEFRILGACTDGTMRLKSVFGTNQMEVTAAAVTYTCMDIIGKNGACDVLDLGGNVTMSCVNLVDMGPTRNENANCTAETFTFRNVIFVANAGNIITEQASSNNKSWVLINPKYTCDPPTCDIDIIGACSDVTELFRQSVVIQNPDGTKISGAILNHISTKSATAAIRATAASNACGVAIIDTEQRIWAGACETLTTSTVHGLQMHDYANTSFATLPTVSNKAGGFGQCSTISVVTEAFTCAAECVAVLEGTTEVTVCGPATNAHSILKYTLGCGTLVVGAVLTGTTSTADGVVKEIIEGCSTTGTVVLTTRDATAFTAAGEAATTPACAWSGCITACSQQCFTYLYCAGQISCVDRTAQQLYDHQKAKLHECPIDATHWDDVKVWGGSEHAHPLQGCSTKFKTVRNVVDTAGWVVTGLNNLGSVEFFTEDDGGTFSPASSVCVAVTVKDSSGVVVSGARVGVFNDPVSGGDTALMCGTTNACGLFTCSITVAGDTNVIVRVRLKGFIPFQTAGVISAATGLTLGVTFITDASVNLP